MELQQHLDEEAAIKAVEKAMKADNSRVWAYAKGKAKRICRDLAAALLATTRSRGGSIFERKKVGKEIICEDGGWADSAIKVKAAPHPSCGGARPRRRRALHAPAGGEVELPCRSPTCTARPRTTPRWRCSSSRRARGGRAEALVSLAHDAPASHSVFLYVLDQHHAQ